MVIFNVIEIHQLFFKTLHKCINSTLSKLENIDVVFFIFTLFILDLLLFKFKLIIFSSIP